LTHPRYAMQKHYQTLVQGCPSESALAALRSGVTITEDNGRSHKTAPAQVHLLRKAGSNCWLALTIHEGRKRQVRRMLAAAGYPVLELIRVGIGPLELGDVAVGEWRYLTSEEVEAFSSALK
jgi:23S rRNA pseudouridine2605 synthase